MFVFIQQMGPGGSLITRLMAESGPLRGKMFRLKGSRVNIGKASDNEVVLQLPQIDDYHAEIDLSGDVAYLRDKGGFNGTWVNEKRVPESPLKHGDKITFGVENDQELLQAGEVLLAKQAVIPVSDDMKTVLGNHGKNWNAKPPIRKTIPGVAGPTAPSTQSEPSFQQRKFEVLLAVSKALSRPEDITNKVHSVLELLFETMELSRAALLVLGHSSERISNDNPFVWTAYRDRRGAVEQMNLSSTIINRVLQEEVAVLTQDAQNEDWLGDARSILGQEIRTCICTPLKTSNSLIGVLYADSTRPASHPFSREDMEFFTAFSNQAAVAVENSRLLRVALEKERIEQDLKVARNIQQMLFPNEIPELDGYELAGESHAMEQVGGDYFDYILMEPHHLALVVADVSGHGVSSSLIMTMTRSILRGSLRSDVLPSQLLKRVNELVSADMLPRMFVTMILVIIDLKTGKYVLSSAGHPPLLHYQKHKDEIIQQKIKSSPLGMSKWARLRPRYRDIQGQLFAGDVIYLYTDGITEVANEQGEQFEERIDEAFFGCIEKTPSDIIQHIFSAAKNFCENQPIADDYTAIALKRNR